MKHGLIVGLGNPGIKYQHTRHNIGFLILESFAEKNQASFQEKKKCAQTSFLESDTTWHLLKPLEFMNLSGNSVSEFVRLYKIPMDMVLVIHDEIDLPFGKIKNKIGGGTAGHNGLKDIVDKVGSSDFHRLRFGVGKPEKGKGDVADFVLQTFFPEEQDLLSGLIADSISKMEDWKKGKSNVKPPPG